MKLLPLSSLVITAALLLSACAADKNTNLSPQSPTNQTTEKQSLPEKKASRPNYSSETLKAIDTSADDIQNALDDADDGNLDNAIDKLNHITKKYPNAFIAFYDLGLLYERKLDSEHAKIAYENALKSEPNFSEALIARVRIDIRDGKSNDALQTANLYIQKNPDIFEYNYAKLEAMIALNQFDDAIALSRALLKKDEANAKLRYYLACVEFERKRYSLANFILGESLEIDPKNPDALFLRAKIHHALSADDVSLTPGIAATLDQVIELNPDHIEALWMRANIYYNASNYDEAQNLYRHILTLHPDLVGVLINLANTLKMSDNGVEAESLLLRAKALDPQNALACFALGTLYLNFELIKLPQKDMDRLKLAKIEFEQAKTLWSSKDDVALADAYIRTTNDAIETLQTMLDAEALFGPSSDDAFGSDDTSGDSTSDSTSNDSTSNDSTSDDSNNLRVD